jgi:predicted signal transduction protein with EAL and GGDEF domain
VAEQDPTQEEIQDALGKIRIGDLLLQTVYTISQLAYQRLTADPPDLAQARLGIDALAALIPVLDVPDQARRDLGQMVSNLKLSYATATATATPKPEPEPDGDG